MEHTSAWWHNSTGFSLLQHVFVTPVSCCHQRVTTKGLKCSHLFLFCTFLFWIRTILIKVMNNLNFHRKSLFINSLTTVSFSKLNHFQKNFSPNFKGQYNRKDGDLDLHSFSLSLSSCEIGLFVTMYLSGKASL